MKVFIFEFLILIIINKRDLIALECKLAARITINVIVLCQTKFSHYLGEFLKMDNFRTCENGDKI
jgi:hypothetical protein